MRGHQDENQDRNDFAGVTRRCGCRVGRRSARGVRWQ